ncbi:MAG: 50S ribosomal protein L39e [Promethearchaeota archaeon]
MARYKKLGKKLRLIKRNRQNISVPTWIIVKSGSRVRTHPKRRQWRNSRLKV